MNLIRWILIGITFLIAAIFTFNVYVWSQEFKDTFLYNNNYVAFIMVFIFVIAITGIFKWFLKEEIILTRPRGKKK